MTTIRADALRFANAAMASLGGVLKLDTQRIAGYRNFGTKLWNACRFAEMNGVWEGHATQAAPPAATATVNRWIIGETARTLAEVIEAKSLDRARNAIRSLMDLTPERIATSAGLSPRAATCAASRARASILPRPCWRATFSSPPMLSASARRRFSSSISSCQLMPRR